jgi:two-component system sensor histidine kinase/response regulator
MKPDYTVQGDALMPGTGKRHDGKPHERADDAIDLGTLRLYVGDDLLAVQDFLGRFFDRLDADMGDLRRTVNGAQWVTAARIAHQMRSSALAIGAVGFAQLCTGIEKMALVPDSEQARARLGNLEHSFSAVQKAVLAVRHANH